MAHSRRALLKTAGSLLLLPGLTRRSLAAAALPATIRRARPSDAAWPTQAAWQRLNAAVGGKLIPVPFPLHDLKDLSKELRNPYWISDQVGLTQTLGWVDAWATKPSVYAVAARNAADIAAAVNFA